MPTHHATLDRVLSIEKYCIPETNSAIEVLQYNFSKLSIEDVRQIIVEAHRRPTTGYLYRHFYFVCGFITEEAQQAMLKLIEEPPPTTFFSLIVPEGLALLATLESRFAKSTHRHEYGVEPVEFVAFKTASYAERLAQIDHNLQNKNVSWQQTIKQGLLTYLYKRAEPVDVSVLQDLEYISRYYLTRGASNKMLLEQLALTLPARY